MSCFCSKPSVAEVPEGPPETWSAAEVKQWLKSEHLKYSSSLKGVDGKKMMETSREEWDGILGAGPSQVLWKALQQLQQKQAPRSITPAQQPDKQEAAQPPVASTDLHKPVEQLEFTDRVTAGSEIGGTTLFQAAASHPEAEEESFVTMDEDTAADAKPAASATALTMQDAAAGVSPAVSPDEVRQVFQAFASFGFPETQSEMDSSKLMKMMRECGLIDAKLTSVDVDLFFLKTKPVKRRITFEQFLDVAASCAKKKGVATEELLRAIVNKGGPDSTGTKAQSVRLADDKSTFTGVSKRGGPSTVDESHDLATILDRGSSRRSTGGKQPAAKPPTGAAPAPYPFASNSTFSKSCVMSVRRTTMSSGETLSSALQGDGMDLQAMFEAFASFGSGGKASSAEMDRSRFAKLCRECDLVDSTTADIVFTQHIKKGSNKITFEGFKACLEQIARDKGVELASLERGIASSGGPMINTTCV